MEDVCARRGGGAEGGGNVYLTRHHYVWPARLHRLTKQSTCLILQRRMHVTSNSAAGESEY